MSDEFESILAESLYERATHAGTHGRGFGDVRRRVRRHRQRQMAAGLLPAVAGFGWIVTRPVADDPLRPGGDAAAGCGDTLPASTWTDWTGEATTLPPGASGPYVTDTNGNAVYVGTSTTYLDAILSSTVPGEVVIIGDVTDNTAASTTTTGYYDSEGNPIGVDTTVEVDANGNVVESDVSSTTIECEEPTAMPPSTGPSDNGDATSTTSTIATFEDNSFVLFVNASTVNGAATAYAAQYPGAQRTSATIKVDTSFVMTLPETEGAARSIANQLGISDVRVGIDASVIADEWDMTGIQVVLVIGEGHALSLTSPTTTAPR